MTHPPAHGFLLQSSYRIERPLEGRGEGRLEGGRPVVEAWGVLESGETFLVRDDRPVPCFHVREADGPRVHDLVGRRLVASELVTMAGEPTLRLELDRPPETPAVRDRLHGAGLATFEADVPFARRWRIDRGIRSAVTLRGPHHAGSGVDRVYENPDLEPLDTAARGWTPRLRVLSFDIETDFRDDSVLSISLFGRGLGRGLGRTEDAPVDVAEVLLVAPEGMDPEEAIPAEARAADGSPIAVTAFAGEGELLAAFARRVRRLDPDALTGWNVAGFDLPVLARAGDRWGGTLELGRGPGTIRLSAPRGRRDIRNASLPGRLVLDGLRLVRGASVALESYSLEAVASEILGEGKRLDADLAGLDKAREILRLHREDRRALVEYNLADARLALEIVERLDLVPLAVEQSLLTGLPPDRLGSSVAAFDFLYLSQLRRRGVVAPTTGVVEPAEESPEGGAVLEPAPGLWDHVLVLDFKSLYPSVIRTFGIDPLTWVPYPDAIDGSGDDLVRAPNGAGLGRSRGILPELLDQLFPRREAALERGDRVAAHAIKILMNSFYGVFGTPACRFHDPRFANVITGFGREILGRTRDLVEELGHRVLYGDTDSLFVASGCSDAAAARQLGHALAARVDEHLAAWARREHGVESRLELRFERLYLKLVLPQVREGSGGGARGARKRYVGLVEEDGERRTVFRGMEAVRRDWTDLARRLQRELYGLLFEDLDPEARAEALTATVRRTLEDLRAGRLDGELIYRKGLRKAPEEYKASTPPHVVAARKWPGKPPSVVAYVMTTAGPEPAPAIEHPLDHEHYVDRQLAPVAAPVLAHAGLDFDALSGRGSQLGLF